MGRAEGNWKENKIMKDEIRGRRRRRRRKDEDIDVCLLRCNAVWTCW
jgi:hypothetical protein